MSTRTRLLYATASATTAIAATATANHFTERERRPLKAACTAPNVSAAVNCLKQSGVGVVHQIVDSKLISEVKATEVFQSIPAELPRLKHTRQRPGKSVERPAWTPSASGRFHRREETWSESDVQVMERVEDLIWPLVLEFFDEDEEFGTQGIFRSELQVMTAIPGSASQAWHRDNHSRGLTIIVPLVDFTIENGATQMLIGSHDDAWPQVAQEGAQVLEAPAGSIAAYDSRTFHRGLGNLTDNPRPAIIFCYDRKWSPPPGCGPMSSIAYSYLAGFLNILSTGLITATSSLKSDV